MELTKQSSCAELLTKAWEDSNFYDQARPSYDKDVVKFFLEKLGLLSDCRTTSLTVLELGCGTGKFTCVMADILRGRNVQIIGCDPLRTMCEQFRLNLPEVEIMQGTSENIALPTSSIDAVIAATSFHWFANKKSLAEINRVLKPDGKLGVIMLYADRSVEWSKELFDYLEPLFYEKSVPFCPAEEWKDFIATSNDFCNAQSQMFRMRSYCTVHSVLEYFMSVSVLSSSSNDVKERFKIFFEQVIEKHFTKKNEIFGVLPLTITLDWYEKQL